MNSKCSTPSIFTKLQNFSISGWGTMVISDDPQHLALSWIRYVRNRLNLRRLDAKNIRAVQSTKDAGTPTYTFARWEVLKLARAFRRIHFNRSLEAIESIHGLLQNNLFTQLEVPPAVVAKIELALAKLNASAAVCGRNDKYNSSNNNGSIVSCLRLTRQGLFLALEAMHDDSMLTQLYFSLEFKAAIYMPILLPCILPLLTMAIGALKQRRKTKQERRAREERDRQLKKSN